MSEALRDIQQKMTQQVETKGKQDPLDLTRFYVQVLREVRSMEVVSIKQGRMDTEALRSYSELYDSILNAIGQAIDMEEFIVRPH